MQGNLHVQFFGGSMSGRTWGYVLMFVGRDSRRCERVIPLKAPNRLTQANYNLRNQFCKNRASHRFLLLLTNGRTNAGIELDGIFEMAELACIQWGGGAGLHVA
ncbi:hypothetical protein C9I56_31560 [Paraburkholderia caribensis]|nr:hypothetical protein C9I56_31560 [Paraburkholderia caribensis]